MLTTQKRPEGQYFKFPKTAKRTPLKTVTQPLETVPAGVLQKHGPVDQGRSGQYKERVRLHFSVAHSLPSEFTFVKGLIEFHRPKDFNFKYDRKQKTISIDVDLDQIDRLATFISGVEEWVRKEKQFRHALKMAIEFERRYQLERESVYAILKNSNGLPTAV